MSNFFKNTGKVRQRKRLQKQISKLMAAGELPADVNQVLDVSFELANDIYRDIATSSSAHREGVDMGMKRVRRPEKDGRREREPGPVLHLTINKLGGTLVSNEEIGELVHFSLIGPAVPKPRWCNYRPWRATSQIIVIRLNCPRRFIENEGDEKFTYLESFYDRCWLKLHKEVGNREEFWKHLLNVSVHLQAQIRERMQKLEQADKPRGALKLDLLMSHADMANAGFPFPSECEAIIPTKDKYAPVTPESPLFALDCEMCITEAGLSELTRISVVSEDGFVLLDTLVKPKSRISDYLTQYSGITPDLLEHTTVTLSDVQAALRASLPPDAILVGHSLEFDMRALRMAHPYCLDVGHLYNLSGSARRRSGLKLLVSMFLDENIERNEGHCSVVDAWMTMRLMQLKLEKGLLFGNHLYGWDHDGWIKEQEAAVDAEIRLAEQGLANGVKKPRIEKEEEEEGECKNHRTKNVKPSQSRSPKPARLCSCGNELDVECILAECQCRMAPPKECVHCLSKRVPSAEDTARMTFDWSSSVRPHEVVETRPLSYYLVDSNKNVLCATDQLNETPPENKLFTTLDPTTFGSMDEFVHEVSSSLLEYALALVELTWTEKEAADRSWAQQISAADEIIEKVLRSAAKFALVMVVVASEETSIGYFKVKK